jgi:hypothetical protein
VISSIAGSKRSAYSSAGRIDGTAEKRIATHQRVIFTTYEDVVAAFVSNAEVRKSASMGAWYKLLYNYLPFCDDSTGASFFS